MNLPYQQFNRDLKGAYPRITQNLRKAFVMGEQPTEELERWAGYFRYEDPTIQIPNSLTFPSINCFIPMKDRIVPRLGTPLIGQGYTNNWPCIGHMKKFTTMGGYEVELRVNQSDDTNLKDIIYVLFPSTGATGQILHGSVTGGPFTVNEKITGGTSGATGYMTSDASGKMLVYNVTGTFSTGETITGLSSAATAVVTSYNQISTSGPLNWFQITQNVNPLTRAVGKQGMRPRYYFDSWFDTNLNPAKSLNLPRAIATNGTTQVLNWTGGIAYIGVVVTNTSISTVGGVTWASQGFVDPTLGGSGNIIINGLSYAITGGWATDTLTLASTTGITTGNIAFSQIQTDSASIPLDMCRNNGKNYMFYGAWNSMKYFQSNGFNKDASQVISNVQAFQNDLVLGTSLYSGTNQHVYRITIDSVNPPINEQTFTPGGSGNLNDGLWQTAGYTGTAGATNIYSLVVIGDYALNSLGFAGAGYQLGEVVKGSISKAEGVIVKIDISGANATMGLRMLTTNTFDSTDTITGLSSATTGPVSANTFLATFEVIKNGVIQAIDMGFGAQTTNYFFGSQIPLSTTVDGLTFKFANVYGHQVGDTFTLKINQGGADTFQWQKDGAAPTAIHVAITGGIQTLELGVSFSFVNKTGHNLGGFWEITATQVVDKAWINFYYTIPVRAPGEGYIYQLPSNFWTMEPQEDVMYVNTKYGYWSYVQTILSANLQSEAVSLLPLKQASTSKVIFPYMITHFDNDLIYVTDNKTLDLIGRLALTQLPQIDTLSQPVQLDFDEATFEDGGMEYWNKMLWINSPHDNVMLVYDNKPKNKYWQPPQVIPGNGIPSIVGNVLITHSNIRNESFAMFSGTNGDNGDAYTVRARSPYNSYGSRWGWKNSNKSFVEGYISGLPPMNFTVYQEIGGCGGIQSHEIKPQTCILPDQAPLGSGNLGSHQNGSDIFTKDSHFYEIYPRFKPILKYRMVAMELSCKTTNHSYSWLTMGLNSVQGNMGTTDLLNKEVVSRQ